jgi:hypothetical protein
MLAGVRRAVALGGMWLGTGCTLGLGGLEAAGGDGSAPTTTGPDASGLDEASPGDDASPPSHPIVGGDAGRPGSGNHDASTPDGPPVGPAPPDGCTNAAGPCVVVPSGWALVAFAPSQASSCPSGFDAAPAQDLVEGPQATGACGCGACSVTAPPSCAAGAIAVAYDEDFSGTCDLVAMPSPLGNSPPGSCGTDIYQGSYATFDARYAAPGPSGGACTSAGVQTSGGVTYAAQDRLCQPTGSQAASCDGGVCRPTLAGPYAACIATPGAVACPPGSLSVSHDVGTSASLSCAACSCSVTGTCSGTLTLYTNTTCTTGPYAISTDVCVAISSAATYKAYKYTAAAAKDVGCQAGAPASANVALAGEQTVCCAP